MQALSSDGRDDQCRRGKQQDRLTHDSHRPSSFRAEIKRGDFERRMKA
jgi:hypothetical protein